MDSEVLKKLNNHKSFELKNANSLKSIVDVTDSSIVKMFLGGIMLDSMKHANILQAILDVDAGQVLWNIDKSKMIKELKEHLEVEEKMLKSIQDVLERNKEKKIEPLLKEIMADEKRHHRILTQLMKTVENLDLIKEEWVDMYVKFGQEDFGRT